MGGAAVKGWDKKRREKLDTGRFVLLQASRRHNETIQTDFKGLVVVVVVMCVCV